MPQIQCSMLKKKMSKEASLLTQLYESSRWDNIVSKSTIFSLLNTRVEALQSVEETKGCSL